MGVLGRNEIQDASKLNTEDISVPEWGGDVRIRELCVRDREDWRDLISAKIEDQGLAGLRSWICARSCIDENGDRLWSDDETDLIDKLDYAGVDRVAEAAMNLNGLNPDAVEQAEKNLETTPSDGSDSN